MKGGLPGETGLAFVIPFMMVTFISILIACVSRHFL